MMGSALQFPGIDELDARSLKVLRVPGGNRHAVGGGNGRNRSVSEAHLASSSHCRGMNGRKFAGGIDIKFEYAVVKQMKNSFDSPLKLRPPTSSWE